MTAAITQRDWDAGATSTRYHYTRVVEIAGRTVRARVQRDYYQDQSFAVVEVLTDQMDWTRLTADAPSNWWRTTPLPHPQLSAAAVLGPLTDQLLHRAAEILAPPPVALTQSPRVLEAVSALLATSHGYDGEHHVDSDEIAWATNHAAPCTSSNTPTAPSPSPKPTATHARSSSATAVRTATTNAPSTVHTGHKYCIRTARARGNDP